MGSSANSCPRGYLRYASRKDPEKKSRKKRRGGLARFSFAYAGTLVSCMLKLQPGAEIGGPGTKHIVLEMWPGITGMNVSGLKMPIASACATVNVTGCPDPVCWNTTGPETVTVPSVMKNSGTPNIGVNAPGAMLHCVPLIEVVSGPKLMVLVALKK